MKQNFYIISLFLFLINFSLHSSDTEYVNRKVTTQNAPIYYSFEKSSREVFNVYVHILNDKYAWFKIQHEVDLNKFKNLWRVMDGYMCEFKDGQMSSLYPILTAGENEFVWRSARPGVEEFTGGYHGNERIDVHSYGKIEFYTDNQLIDLSASIPLTAGQSFYYIQHSTMHETGTGGLIGTANYKEIPGHPIECFHEKKTVFSNKGYETFNKVTWDNNCTPVRDCYYGILCVTGDIAKTGYNEAGTNVTFNDDGAMKLRSTGSKIVMSNTDLGITVTCDAKLLKPTGIYKTGSMIWDKGYHKYYCFIDNGATTGTRHSEVCESTSSIKLELTQ